MATAAAGDGLVVGIDLATRTVRVACADPSGTVRASATVELPSARTPQPGWSEQDPKAWWPAVASAVREATSRLDREADDIVAVTVSATSGTVLLADDEGEPVGPALMYDDQRAAAEAGRAQEAGRDRWDALGLRIAPTFGLPKWAWLLARPDIAERARFAWHASDLIVSRLIGGPPRTDWSHGLKSGYDPLRGEWATEAMEAVGIPARLLPEVAAPATPVGSVVPAAASSTGLPAGCQVRLGMTDSCAGQLAAGADRPGRFVSVLGTTLVLKGATEALVRDPTGAVYSHRHPDGWWLPGGASNTGGAALTDGFGDADLGALDEAAAARGPARCVVYPLTGKGERFPFVEPDAHGFTLDTPEDDVERYRATLEGVAFLERLGCAHLTSLGAAPTPPLAVAGGGSRSRAWNAVRATVLGLPLVVPARATTASGACILAAAGTLYDSVGAAIEAMVTTEDRVEPAAAEREALEDSYGRFVGALADRGWIGDELRRAALAEGGP